MNKKHVFLVGAKSLGSYGGYETFINKLTEYHENDGRIKYHVACKANGSGCMDETKLSGVSRIRKNKKGETVEFTYHGAHCFKLHVPNIGPAQAVFYDIIALRACLNYIEKNHITDFVIYVMACRIGPFFGHYVKWIHRLCGRVLINPDGHEWLRAKWSKPVRKYWKYSERLMVKHADLVICDSVNIEKYIVENYKKYSPATTYIAYGAETRQSEGAEDRYSAWLSEKGMREKEYYLVVGRFVPENNYETMLREFMNCHSEKTFAIITNADESFLNRLEDSLHFKRDGRIKFVGTVYDEELLKRIREGAYAYLHGHEVGGTNPSLLEALGSTNLNLLLDVGFNREVALDAALYWSKKRGNLAGLIDKADKMSADDIQSLGTRAKKRIKTAYSWEYISNRYADVFLFEGNHGNENR